MGWSAGILFPAGAREFCLLHSVQTGSEARTGSYSMGTGGSTPEVKRPGRETGYLPPSSAKVKNGGAMPPLIHLHALGA
jgi:hypothetical protein